MDVSIMTGVMGDWRELRTLIDGWRVGSESRVVESREGEGFEGGGVPATEILG